MTKLGTKQISDMTNSELNEAIAFEVMGWHIDEFGYWMDADDEHTGYIAIIHPTIGWIPAADINQARACVDKLQKCNGSFVGIKNYDNIHGEVDGYSCPDNFARAMCEAMLMAKRAK